MHRRTARYFAAFVFVIRATGQWLNYPAPGIPRLPDGRPNLSAPTPRTPDGKPDLSGIWVLDRPPDPFGDLYRTPDDTQIEIKPEDVILTPEGEALRGRMQPKFLGARCLPRDLALYTAVQPFKMIAFKGALVLLYEYQTTYRQIFMDGRKLPKDPNPAWWGYSVGKWDGDTLVVDTTGFNDDVPLTGAGHPHSDALHVIQRFRRRDFGHLEIQFTIDDPKVYAKPWSFKEEHHLTPDTELLEFICNENEKDLKHIMGVK
jgi:hypothetical protein